MNLGKDDMPDDPLPVVIVLPCVDGTAVIAVDDRPAIRDLKAARAALSSQPKDKP